MLKVTIPKSEFFDEETNEFVYVNECTLALEHSLVSISKWESKWCKPFISSDQKTHEETIDYIRCMTLTQNVNPDVYNYIPSDVIAQIQEYIDAPMTATWFSKNDNARKSREIITSELIYYWMIALNIPFECQKWHFNRLLTLIRVCSLKNSPPKKMSQKDILSRNRALNAARRKAAHHSG